MTNETAPPTLRQQIAKLFRLAADAMAPSPAERPTIDAIKNCLAYDVEVALLRAEEDEERAVHTTLMLRQRLRRLNGDRHPPSGVPAGAGARPAEVVCGGAGDHRGLPVPAGRPTLAEPEAAVRQTSGRAFRPLREQGTHVRDRRRRRALHRAVARSLERQDTRGSSILRSVIQWHLQQARRP